MAKAKVRLNTPLPPPADWVLGVHSQIPLQRLAWFLNQVPGIQLSLYSGHHPALELNDLFAMLHEEEVRLLLVEAEWLRRKSTLKSLKNSPFNVFVVCPDNTAIPASMVQVMQHLQGLSGISLAAPFVPSSDILNILAL